MNKKNDSSLVLRIFAYTFLIAGAILMVGPFLWTLSTSLKGGAAVMKFPPELLPKPIYWSNYAKVWEQIEFFRYTLNSFIITSLAVIGSILSGSFAGFGLSKMKFKGQGLIFFIALATLMMPYQACHIKYDGK